MSVGHLRAQTTLVPFGATWRYLADGSNQGTAWREAGFDDSSWAQGVAEFGYGDGDEATVVGYGGNASAKFITTYFRTAFMVPEVAGVVSLLLEVERDDGVVVYLNGTEVVRGNLPGGAISNTTLATSAIEDTVDSISIPPTALGVGANTLAVEIHQAAGTSSDISFNLRLTARSLTATAVSPADGAVALADPVTLTASGLHPEASPLSITFQGRERLPVAAEAWNVIQVNGGVTSGAQTSASWSGLKPGATYEWQALVSDGTRLVATAPRTFSTQALNPDAPIAHPQTLSVVEDGTTTLTLTGTSQSGAALIYSILSAPAHGQLTGAPPEMVYTPAANYYGSDFFTFRVDDGSVSAPAAVTLTVSAVNDAPTVTSLTVITESDSPTPLTLGGADADGDPLTYTVVEPPVHGTLTGSPPSLIYLSAPGFIGQDSLTYAASDGQATSVNATITLSVGPPTLDTLIPAGALWKYLDNGSNQGTAWRNPEFDDTAWAQGPAQLGYGDGDEATVVSFGPSSTSRFITTYFRREFQVPNPNVLGSLKLDLLRDDGAIIYLNGTEILRSNMPVGAVAATTTASSSLGVPAEATFYTTTLNPAQLATGRNVLAVEVHQGAANSSDLSFDLKLYESPPAGLTRGPYLQLAGANRTSVRWRTDTPTTSVVRYGLAADALTMTASNATPKTEHEVALTGLSPGTTYFYSVGSAAGTFAGGNDYSFVTHPLPGTAKPSRFWVLGDPGTGDANQRAVRDRFYALNGSRRIDGVLVLGDTVYESGTDPEFQTKFFEVYPTLMRQTAFWPTFGNHEGLTANSGTQSGPYFDVFTLPKNGEAGGLASGTEAYYSFDIGNVHFVCLDSEGTSRSSSGVMANWLRQDLAATTQEWIVAFWHHPAYCRGTRDSDNATTDSGRLRDMREIFVPILEDYGVDLVLFGHEHNYQRSKLIDGHYGVSGTFNPATMLKQDGFGDPARDAAYVKPAGSHHGAVYAVAGSSGKLSNATLNHPIMVSNFAELGSMILDVDGRELTARFLNSSGLVRDTFTLVHNSPPQAVPTAVAGPEDAGLAVTLSAVDVENDPLTYAMVSLPLHGTLSGTAPNLFYQPDPDYHGPDGFSFTASDGTNVSSPVAVTITIAPVNDPPVAFAANAETDQDRAVDVVLTATDIDSTELTFVLDRLPTHGTVNITGSIARYQPVGGFTGNDDFSVAAYDGVVPSVPVAVTITVVPVTDPPVNTPPVAASQTVVTLEDQAVEIVLAGSDADDDPLTFQLTTAPLHGSLSGSPPRLVYTPATNYNGPDGFEFTAFDGTAVSQNAGSISLTVAPVNDPPLIAATLPVVTTTETPAAFTLEASDVDGDPLSFVIVTAPSSGSLSGSGPDRVYTPAPGFSGVVTATWRASDGQAESSAGEIAITVSRPGTWDVVAVSGESAPGVPSSFFAPLTATAGLDRFGLAAFRATTTAGAAATGGIWSETTAGLGLLVAPGMPAPGLSGPVFGAPTVQPWSGGSGDVLVLVPLQTGVGGVTTANDMGLWLRRAGGPMELITREDAAAPSLPPGTKIAQLGTNPTLQADGQLTFTGLLRTNTALGITTANDGVLWSLAGGTASVIYREGAPSPAGAAGELLDTPTTAVIRSNAAGQAAVRGVLKSTAGVTNDNKNALWLWDGGQLNQIMRGAQPAAGTAAGSRFNKALDHVLTETGLVFTASLLTSSGGVTTSTDTGVWLLENGTLTLMAREGSQAAGIAAGGMYGQMTEAPSMNDDTAFSFRNTLRSGGGVTNSTNAGVWTRSPFTAEALAIVARKGSPAAQTPTDATFASFDLPIIDPLGREAFTATLNTGKAGVTTSNNRGLWARATDGRLTLLVRTGDPMALSTTDVRTVGNVSLPPSPLSGKSAWSGDGRLLVLVTFTDSSTALLRCTLP